MDNNIHLPLDLRFEPWPILELDVQFTRMYYDSIHPNHFIASSPFDNPNSPTNIRKYPQFQDLVWFTDGLFNQFFNYGLGQIVSSAQNLH